jgi:single-stranded DNA-binding protein
MQSTTTISGNLAEKPLLRRARNEKYVSTLRVAVNDHRLGDEPRYVDVDQWEGAAVHAVEHLVKGQHVVAEGLLDAEPYTKNDGALAIGWRLKRAHVEWGAKPRNFTEDPSVDAAAVAS